MTETHWSLRPPAERPAKNAVQDGNPVTQRRLAQAIAAKLATGYGLQSQTATAAVMSIPPRRYLGLTLPGRTKREIIAVGPDGRVTTQPL